MRGDEPVVRGQRGKLVCGADERQPARIGQFRRYALAEFRMGVQAGPDCGAADGERVERRQRRLDERLGMVELGDVAGELLAQGQRRGVLQMGAADLDDAGESGGLRRERRAQPRQRRQQRAHDAERGGKVHRGGKKVVGRLPEIDFVVGMHQPVLPPLPAEQLGRAIGQHLVHVHIALRAGAGLPDGQGELLPVAAAQDFFRRRDDGRRLLPWQQAQFAIDPGAGGFRGGERKHEFLRHALGGNGEVLERALRLGTPEPVCGHLDGAERVAFRARCAHGLLRGCECVDVRKTCAHCTHVANMARTTAAMVAVASQPRTLSRRVMTNGPMISLRTAISIITAMMGTATTPLMTAHQNSALIGSMGVKLSATPRMVATTTMA